MKKLILLIFSAMMGIFLAPEILATADSFTIKAPKLDDSETVVIAPVVAQTTSSTVVPAVSSNMSVQIPSSTVAASIQAPIRDNITIFGRSLAISAAASPSEDAGGAVKSYGKMLYGHNSAAVFRNLVNAQAGTTFTVTQGGVTRTYRVAETATFEKISSTALKLGEQKYTMAALAKNARGHNLVLITCAGESYGNGDASHRLAVFADEI